LERISGVDVSVSHDVGEKVAVGVERIPQELMSKFMFSCRAAGEPIRIGEIIDAQECDGRAIVPARETIRSACFIRYRSRRNYVESALIKSTDLSLAVTIHRIGFLRVRNVQLDI
jgi:hypothetical protein